MYDGVYEAMVAAGIASKFDAPVWFNNLGNIVEHAENGFGLQSKYFLLKPDKLLCG
jgi:hypothetical protein